MYLSSETRRQENARRTPAAENHCVSRAAMAQFRSGCFDEGPCRRATGAGGGVKGESRVTAASQRRAQLLPKPHYFPSPATTRPPKRTRGGEVPRCVAGSHPQHGGEHPKLRWYGAAEIVVGKAPAGGSPEWEEGGGRRVERSTWGGYGARCAVQPRHTASQPAPAACPCPASAEAEV